MSHEDIPPECLPENLSANTQYILDKLKKYSAAQDTTIAHLTRRVSMLENEKVQMKMVLTDDIRSLRTQLGQLIAREGMY